MGRAELKPEGSYHTRDMRYPMSSHHDGNIDG